MLRKKKAEQKLLGPVDIQTVIELLREQIAHARQLLNSRPIKSRDLEGWNSRTRVSLIRIYGEGSPNVDTIVGASGAAPVWIFMPDDVKEKYEASCLENKARLRLCGGVEKKRGGIGGRVIRHRPTQIYPVK